MAIDTIKATAILDGAVDTADLADGAVTTAKITDGEVTDAKIASGITSSKLTGALPAIDGSSLIGVDPADGSITTAKLDSTLDLSGKTVTYGLAASDLPDGAVVGGAMDYDSTAYTTTSGLKYTVASVSYTPKFDSGDSDIYMFGVVAHGLGPNNTNLDPYGLQVGFEINGSNTGVAQYSDVFAGSGPGVGYGPEWDVRTFAINYKHTGTWTSGIAITFGIYADNDATGGIFINRCATNAQARGTSSIHILEIKK